MFRVFLLVMLGGRRAIDFSKKLNIEFSLKLANNNLEEMLTVLVERERQDFHMDLHILGIKR